MVESQTRWDVGLVEREAAREWSAIYSAASGPLHGSASDAASAHDLYGQLVAAFGRLFLSLPERADEIRALALTESPTAADAAEVAAMTDRQAGEYCFRAATSADWLDLLTDHRLLPEPTRWPARPYLLRQLERDPDRVCRWVEARLGALDARDAGAMEVAVGLLCTTGMALRPRKATKWLPSRPHRTVRRHIDGNTGHRRVAAHLEHIIGGAMKGGSSAIFVAFWGKSGRPRDHATAGTHAQHAVPCRSGSNGRTGSRPALLLYTPGPAGWANRINGWTTRRCGVRQPPQPGGSPI